MKLIGTLLLGALCLNGLHSVAKDSSMAKPYSQTLGAAPAAELPATAATLVQSTKARDREAATPEVVKAAVKLNPAAAAPIVGAVAKAVPDMSGAAAAAAAAEQPKQACAIARAAAAAAPAKAGKIVAAVCQVVPEQYRAVAVAVAEVVPTSGKEIVKSVGTAVPELKPFLEAQMSGSGLGLLPVGATLDQAGRDWRLAGGPLPLTPSSAPMMTAVPPPTISGPGSSPVVGPPSTDITPSTPDSAAPPSVSRPNPGGSPAPSTSGNYIAPGRDYARP